MSPLCMGDLQLYRRAAALATLVFLDNTGAASRRLSPPEIVQNDKSSTAPAWNISHEKWSTNRDRPRTSEDAELLPPEWSSTSCMQHWGLPHLQDEPDPEGYLIFVDGREQLGSNRYLVSDGLFIAKALNRTLVEFPVADSRIAGADAELGLGAYWDMDRLCRYHRILSLRTFRNMIDDGRLDAGAFVYVRPVSRENNILHAMRDEDEARAMYEGFENQQVIVGKDHWRSYVKRGLLDLFRPNAFYASLARRLVDAQEGWAGFSFVAVQWRTETATGSLPDCYVHLRDKVESVRAREGVGRHQVFFNTDLVNNASTTYTRLSALRKIEIMDLIRADYPAAKNNTFYAYANKVQDAGVRAIASGVVAASSRVLLASTRQNSKAPHAGVCQKIRSHFIDIVMEWRSLIRPQGQNVTVSLFPRQP